MYLSKSTHIVVPDKIAENGTKWCPKLFGALAGAKHVVTAKYLLDCDEAGKFLEEKLYIPGFVTSIVDHIEKNGKPFQNQTSIVIINNPRRQAELKIILRDGGANVEHWGLSNLKHLPLFETRKLDYIYTDTLHEKALDEFVDRVSPEGDGNLKVLSYFCIFKVITMPVEGPDKRKMMEAQFNVKNKELMNRLHPPLPTSEQPRTRIGQRSFRHEILYKLTGRLFSNLYLQGSKFLYAIQYICTYSEVLVNMFKDDMIL